MERERERERERLREEWEREPLLQEGRGGDSFRAEQKTNREKGGARCPITWNRSGRRSVSRSASVSVMRSRRTWRISSWSGRRSGHGS